MINEKQDIAFILSFLPTVDFIHDWRTNLQRHGISVLQPSMRDFKKKQPDFDSRCFGYPKLSVMFESLEDLYIIEKRANETGFI